MNGLGSAVIIGSLVGAVSFVIRNTFNNFVSGLWIKHSGEVREGDEITIKTDFKEKSGTVKDIHMRNIVIELGSGKDLLVETKKVFEEDVIRKRSK